jgi:hypothetical protein
MHRFALVFVFVIGAALGAGCGSAGYPQGFDDGSGPYVYGHDGSAPYVYGQQGWVARGGVRDERRPAAESARDKAQRSNQKATHAATQRSSAPAAKADSGDDHK